MRRNCGILAHIRNLYRISMKVGTPRLPLLLLLLRAGWAGGAVGKSVVAWWLLMIKSLRSEEGKKEGSVISSKARINSLCLMQPEYTRSGVCVWCGRDKLAHINGGVCSCGGSRWREEVFFFSFILVAGIIVAAGKAASISKLICFASVWKKWRKNQKGESKSTTITSFLFVPVSICDSNIGMEREDVLSNWKSRKKEQRSKKMRRLVQTKKEELEEPSIPLIFKSGFSQREREMCNKNISFRNTSSSSSSGSSSSLRCKGTWQLEGDRWTDRQTRRRTDAQTDTTVERTNYSCSRNAVI